MTGKLVYLGREWRDEAETRLKTELSPEKMNHITSSMANIYKNCPDGKERFLYFKYEEGTLTEILVGEGEPPKAEFRITGDYQTFARVTRTELSSQKALMTGKLKLKGNMVKALKLAAVSDRVQKVLSAIPAEY